ncbi:MAG: TolC family protein [candidate division KSB1 bacterium]|nr:TolC family protein [candidate division KSB1 bacterium]MDZ7273226.1 TolC family protein [candidate division KSB1 bacterium]MDZ7285328.1 TolC family protein [candidate division KSB1 bacterium]MDZ7298360.1 TolC family protein [candidate division KSB1 bacterium]MDZ7308524.1 TolC family protein [candidate division KSB1 bacterium]
MPSSTLRPHHLTGKNKLLWLGALLAVLAGWPEAGVGGSPAGGRGAVVKQGELPAEELAELLKKPLSLEACLAIAQSHNLALKQFQRQRDIAAALVSESYGSYFPLFTVTSSHRAAVERTFELVDNGVTTRANRIKVDNIALAMEQKIPSGARLRFINEIDRDTNNDDRLEDLPTRTFRVEVVQPLLQNIGPKFANASLRAARKQLAIEELKLEDFRLQTLFAVKVAYYNVLRLRQVINIHRAALQHDSLLVQASESKVVAKIATRRDVLSAEIRVQEDQAALLNAETDYQTALDQLKEQMGLPITLPITIAADTLGFRPPLLNEEEWIKLALQNNPALRAAELTISLRDLQASVAGNRRLPVFNAVGSYARSFDRDEERDPNGSSWSIGLNLSYPFLAPTYAAEAEIARLERSRAEDAYQTLQRQTILAVRQIHRKLQNSIARLAVLQRSITAAREKVEFATTMFNMGRASNLDITDAIEALLRAETGYIEELVDFHVQFALLERLAKRSFLKE